MVNGQSELAAVGLRDFLADQARPPSMRAGLRAARRGAGELQGKWAEAGDAFTRRLASGGRSSISRPGTWSTPGGPIASGGKTAEALAAYREMIQKYPKTSSFTEAQVRLAEMTDGKM